MLSLLALSFAGSAPAGCFNGGALVGAQVGYMYLKLKQEAKAKPITKAEADAFYNVVRESLADEGMYAVSDDKDVIKSIKEFNEVSKVATLVITSTDELKSEALYKKLAGFAGLRGVRIVLLTDKAGKDKFDKAAAAKIATDFLGKEEDFSGKLVKADGEQKYSSNNGFAGIHAGYLGRINDKFLVGGLVEGNWVFGQDMKVDSVAVKDTSARFNVNIFLRAMFNLTEKFMVGADLGFSGQEIRQLKSTATVAAGATAKSSDKESKWFWNPAARLVLGVALTENILATAHFGGVFPMMKQDSLDKSVKAKYSNFHGGVGISYAFGG